MLPPPYKESTCADKALQARKTLPTCITQRDGAAARWEAQCTCVVSLANVIVQEAYKRHIALNFSKDDVTGWGHYQADDKLRIMILEIKLLHVNLAPKIY